MASLCSSTFSIKLLCYKIHGNVTNVVLFHSLVLYFISIIATIDRLAVLLVKKMMIVMIVVIEQ